MDATNNLKALTMRLLALFLSEVKGFEQDANGRFLADGAYKSARANEIISLLAGGHTQGELVELFQRHRLTGSDVLSVSDLFQLEGRTPKLGVYREDPNNLMENGRFYYHVALQEVPPPPQRWVNEYGDSEVIETPFFLEMKERFTAADLEAYYRRFMPLEGDPRAIRGAFEYLAKTYDLELLLYMIDATAGQCQLENYDYPLTPLEVKDRVREARLLLQDRMNTCKEGGITRVIPRPLDPS